MTPRMIRSCAGCSYQSWQTLAAAESSAWCSYWYRSGPDLMDDVMAESHVPERSRLTGWAKSLFVVFEELLNLLGYEQMVRVGLTVY